MSKTLPVITISREYAAYGRTIAAALSKQLGIPYYDKDFVKETAKVSGYSEEEIEKEGENMSRGSKLLNDFLNNAVTYSSSYDGIYKAQREVVLSLAKQPCIIVGRCADYILQEAGVESFDIFLYADMEHRIARAKELHLDEESQKHIQKIIEKHDEMRSVYYKQYTGREMGDYQNYNISLDVGTIGVDKCVELLCGILKGI